MFFRMKQLYSYELVGAPMNVDMSGQSNKKEPDNKHLSRFKRQDSSKSL
jgi:hypothetical protein